MTSPAADAGGRLRPVDPYVVYVDILVHRVLAQHAAFERCDQCPEYVRDESGEKTTWYVRESS